MFNRFNKNQKNKHYSIDNIDENVSSDNDSGGEELYKNKPIHPIINRSAQNNYEQDNKFGSVAPDARIRNPIMFQQVKHVIQNIKSRRLTFGESTSLRNLIDSLPTSKLSQFSDREIEKKIVNEWLKGQNLLNNEASIIDTHELLKKNIGLNSENDTVTTSINKTSTTSVIANAVDLSSVLGNNDAYSIQRIINPKSLYTQTQILLDTRWRSLDTDGTTIFKWSFSNNLSALQGTFNTTSPIRDIIAIKILPFKIPYTSNAENPTKNITMYFNEFSNQCVIAQERRRYHYWLDYIKEDDWLSLNAKNFNEGVYNFDKPITTLDTLTVNFGSPLQIIQFDYDRLNATFTIGNPTLLTFSIPHNLDNGFTIYFTDFSTTNIAADAGAITALNNNNGLEVTRINTTQVTIAIDTSALVGTPNIPIAFFGEKRIYIPIEITYIRPKS